MTPPVIRITVESLGGLGDGIATYDGKPVFIAKACAGDELEARIVHENHDGLQAFIVRIVSPGPGRQEAPCPYFDRCGGCTLQQLSPDHYKDFKTRLMRSALMRAGFDSSPAEMLFLPAASRRRVEFKIHHDNDTHRLSFHALRSHDAIAVDSCLVLRPELQALIAPVNAALNRFAAARHLFSVSLTQADSGIDMMLTFKGCDLARIPALEPMCAELGLARISIRLPDGAPVATAQRKAVEMQLGPYAVALPADAFLQASREGQEALTRFAVEGAGQADAVADLFCGIGTYSFPLAAQAEMYAAEGSAAMISAMQAAVASHGIRTLEPCRRDLFKQALNPQELARFGAVIINPPRVGAKAQSEQLAHSGVPSIVMISCNPATFARDAKILKEGGYTLARALGIDQFVWNPHLEIAALFTRSR